MKIGRDSRNLGTIAGPERGCERRNSFTGPGLEKGSRKLRKHKEKWDNQKKFSFCALNLQASSPCKDKPTSEKGPVNIGFTWSSWALDVPGQLAL
jgi:hypothetical protein